MNDFILLLLIILILQVEILWIVFVSVKNYYGISSWIYEVDKDLEILEREIYHKSKGKLRSSASDNPYQE